MCFGSFFRTLAINSVSDFFFGGIYVVKQCVLILGDHTQGSSCTGATNIIYQCNFLPYWCKRRRAITILYSLLSSCPNKLLNKLQKVQNSAARLAFKAQKQEHIRPLLQKLHWLPVHSRIQYKISTLCYNSFSEIYPICLNF